MLLLLLIPVIWGAPASASTAVDCGSGANLQTAINQAAPGSTLALTGTCRGNFTIGKDLTLKGQRPPGFPEATLDGQGSGTTLTVTSGRVHLIHLTITGGNTDQGGGIDNAARLWLERAIVTGNIAADGGGIVNTGVLRLTRSFVTSNGNGTTYNRASHPDQGILNEGGLTLVSSVVSLNEGGGIWNQTGSLLMERSSVRGNQVGGARAAGLENDASATITDSTVSDGFTEYDGTPGVVNMGSMTIAFSTIARNYGFNNNSGGGGIENGGTLTVTSSTISENSSDAITGSGIANGDPLNGTSPGTVKISGTILAGNDGGDCLGPITSEGYNIVGTLFGYPDCRFKARRTDVRGSTTSSVDPRLESLGFHGGPTETMPPRAGSPAVNAIPVGAISADLSTALCPTSGTTDQRGVPRPQGAACEIGAVEMRG